MFTTVMSENFQAVDVGRGIERHRFRHMNFLSVRKVKYKFMKENILDLTAVETLETGTSAISPVSEFQDTCLERKTFRVNRKGGYIYPKPSSIFPICRFAFVTF